MWIEDYIDDPNQKFTKETASINLQISWKGISEDNIKGAWDSIFENGKKYFNKAFLNEEFFGESENEYEEESSSVYQE
jgi:hypothetical protein